MLLKKIIAELKLWLFGRCAFPGGRCDQPGTEAFHPHVNSRPVYLCIKHKSICTAAKRDNSGSE